MCIFQVTTRALPHLEEDGRLLPMLCGLSKRYLGQDFNAKKSNVGEITADMIETVGSIKLDLKMDGKLTAIGIDRLYLLLRLIM